MPLAKKDLTGQVAVVTGGSRGIGKAVAFALRERGANIVIGDIRDEEGAQVVKEMNEKCAKITVRPRTIILIRIPRRI